MGFLILNLAQIRLSKASGPVSDEWTVVYNTDPPVVWHMTAPYVAVFQNRIDCIYFACEFQCQLHRLRSPYPPHYQTLDRARLAGPCSRPRALSTSTPVLRSRGPTPDKPASTKEATLPTSAAQRRTRLRTR